MIRHILLLSMLICNTYVSYSQDTTEEPLVELYVLLAENWFSNDTNESFIFELYEDSSLIYHQKTDGSKMIVLSERSDRKRWMHPNKNYTILIKEEGTHTILGRDEFTTNDIEQNTRIIREIHQLVLWSKPPTQLTFAPKVVTLNEDQIRLIQRKVSLMKDNDQSILYLTCTYHGTLVEYHKERINTIIQIIRNEGIDKERIDITYRPTTNSVEKVKFVVVRETSRKL